MPRRNRDEGEHRIRRFQRSRGCKKTRRTIDESNLRLLDLPDDVILEILQFSQPPNEQKRWLWVCQVGSLCSVFYRLLKEALLAPSKLRIPTACNHLPPAIRVPFIQSLLGVPTKTLPITCLVIDCRCKYLTTENSPLRTLMTTPGRFANLTSLELRGFEKYTELNSVIDEFCRNLPNLTELSLMGSNSPVLLSDEQFASFAASLQRPLRRLYICMLRLTRRQVLTFLQQRTGVALECLSVSLYDWAQARSDVLFFITQHCPNIQDLHIWYFNISDRGLKHCLNRSSLPLVNLNLSYCLRLTADVVPHLANYAPGLKFFSADHCPWLTDQGLETILQGQLDHLRRNGSHEDIPLEMVNAFGSSLTEAGARRILEKDGIGELTIHGTKWMVSNKYLRAARPSEAS